MRRVVLGLLWVVGLAGWVGFGGWARADEELDQFNARVTEELRAQAPDAVAPWQAANAARDREDIAAAEQGYRDVLARAPGFNHAHRRLCSVLIAADRQEEGVTECRAALAAADTEENRVQLAAALLATPRGSPPAATLAEADELVRADATRASPTANALTTFCQIALMREDDKALNGCVSALPRVAPDHPLTHMLQFGLAMQNEDWSAAERHLERARLMLSDEGYRALKRKIEEKKPSWPGTLRLAAISFGSWIAGMVLLLILGLVLSWLTLRAASRPPQGIDEETSGGASRFRRGLAAMPFT